MQCIGDICYTLWMNLLAFLCFCCEILNVQCQIYSCSRLMKKPQCKRAETESPFLMSRYIGNGDWMATVAKIKPHRWRFFLSVADESLHISDRVGDTDPFSVAEGVFGLFPMCRSVLVFHDQKLSSWERREGWRYEKHTGLPTWQL